MITNFSLYGNSTTEQLQIIRISEVTCLSEFVEMYNVLFTLCGDIIISLVLFEIVIGYVIYKRYQIKKNNKHTFIHNDKQTLMDVYDDAVGYEYEEDDE